MRSESIALNYAETLFALGEKSGHTGRYADWIESLAGAVEVSPRIQAVLMSPRVTKAEKARLLTHAVKRAPREFGYFLAAVVRRGRQALLGQIAREYLDLHDLKLNRVRAGVTLARVPNEALKARIVEVLERQLGREVIAHFEEDPGILGGIVVRLGDRVLDGSVRRRIVRLRRQLLSR